MDLKLELVGVPVTDIDRAKEFYMKAGFSADVDTVVNESLRFVQLTPPGSACSICLGKGLTKVEPGALDLLQVVVGNADDARKDLSERGIEVSDVEELPWGRFVYFNDPDGNRWSVQELPKR